MNSEWKLTTLGEFCPFSYGKALPERKRKSGTVPVISSAGIVGYHDEALVKTGGIVIGRKGTVGSVTLSKKPFWAIDTAFFIVDKPEQRDLFFTYYLLKTLSLSTMNSDSAVPGLNRENAHNLSVNIPPLHLQYKISNFLTILDDRIHLLRETNATLESIAQALFKSWFVDFDPVRAKAEGRTPEGIDAETAALFPDRFEESELGIIPQGWEVKSLGGISEILNGYAFKSQDYVSEDNGCFVLRTKNFNDNGYANRLSDDVFLSNTFTKSYQKYFCEPFDFHLVMVGASLGKTSILLPHILPALRNQNMWCFRPKGFPSKFFIHETVKLMISDVLRWSSGSAREFFKKGDFEKIKLICPPDAALLVFEKIVDNLKNKIATNENQSNLLSELRDLLLPRLISGQLRLPEAKSIIENAL